MSQTAPATPEKKLSAREIEMHWYNTVYQGDSMPQLTLRAIIMGSFLGGFMSLSNLYVGLKTGWGLGVAITSCILSFSIYKTLRTLFPKWFPTDMSILENNCMQSTASSAGSSTGGTMVSAISAYLLVTGHHISPMVLVLWTFCLASLGCFLAIPMKRQMINVEQLRFPSGIAAAETLRSLHSEGAEAMDKAKSLGIAGLFGAIITWLRDAGRPFAIPGSLNFPGMINGLPLAKYTISFEMSAIMIAAGAIMGWKIAWSMLLGATINWAVLAPWMADIGAIDASKLGYREIVKWSTWTGASIMVSSGLLYFLFEWRTVVRAIGGFSGSVGAKRSSAEKTSVDPGAEADEPDPLARIEVPGKWFLLGAGLSGLGCMLILKFAFGTSLLMGALAVFLTFFLGLVACRATGESDITPVGAMGKITQLFFGAIAPTNIVTNLMTASVTAGAAGASADLLVDLKSGYLLGANPRKQFIAQYLGIFAGTAVVVPAFYLLIPDASILGSDKWPAPAAQVWAAVAKLLASGFQALHPSARMGMLVGCLIGIIIPLVERAVPAKVRSFIPSATGLGLAMVIPFYNSLSMFIGAFIALVMGKKVPKIAEKYIIPVSSGIIAGESLLGIVVAILLASGMI